MSDDLIKFEIPDIALLFIEKCVAKRLDEISSLTGRPMSHNFIKSGEDVECARFEGSYFDEDGRFVRLYWGEHE